MTKRSKFTIPSWTLLVSALSLLLAMEAATIAAPAAVAAGARVQPKTVGFVYPPSHVAGNLDCNGYSPMQHTILPPIACTDVKGAPVENANVWGGRFYDNGHYIGHDEPDMTFFSNQPGSGNDVNWSETLPKDPAPNPTVKSPGHDVVHWFELSVAPWFGMDLCDGSSYPQLPCKPNSDSNAPACVGPACAPSAYEGGGSAFLEMQFYPPGDGPFADSVSCNNTSWCASLHINELECTFNFGSCNPNCEETTNFAFVQRNGVPTGPPSPQLGDLASSTPNSETLMMKPGDRLKVHIWDAPAPADPKFGIKKGMALEVSIDDLTSGQSGFMQASAANGFAQTSMQNCSGRPFNFEPEYSTSRVGDIAPWAALQANISTEFEIGHFVPCTSLFGNGGDGAGGSGDPVETTCRGPYENPTDGVHESTDAPCFTRGDTHGTLHSDPNEVTGCLDTNGGGDLDFDGTSYRVDYPTSATINRSTSKVPSSFVQSMPTSLGHGYPEFMFQTDTALSEAGCAPAQTTACVIPPRGPEVDQPGHNSFYPFWSVVQHGKTCKIEFGDVTKGADDFGRDAQYGSAQFATLGYPEFEGKIYDNVCPAQVSEGYFLISRGGHVVAAGDAPKLPSARSGPVVGLVATPSGKGYFAVTDTGVVETAGDAHFVGDLVTLKHPVKVRNIVAIAPTTDGHGYWLIGSDGGIFAFGDASYHGSIPGLKLHVRDVIGMVATPSGRGYLIVGSDGGVFAFGQTHFYGSLPGLKVHVNDIRGILPSAAGTGYILVGSDGGAFIFGRGVPFHGSLPGKKVHVTNIVGIALTTDNGGYWMAGSDGKVYPFGDARVLRGSPGPKDLPITAIAGVTTDFPNLGP
jgi:hypothetical protein